MIETIASLATSPKLPSRQPSTPPRSRQSSPLEASTSAPSIAQQEESLSPLQLPSRASSGSPPSSPLSEFAKTPSPPGSPSLPPMKVSTSANDPSKRYPSPSATSQSGAPDNDHDGQPPAKKRRVQAPPRRARMTRHLDLTGEDMSEHCETELGYLLRALRTKKKIVVIAGAGISVSAGIPDFRSSTGLFTTLRGQHGLKGSGKHLFDASVYKHDSSTSSFHTMVRELAHMTQKAKPTAFHHMLASLAQDGRLMRLYSQNVDCIDTSMEPLATNVPLNTKGPWPTTIQLHGGLAKMVCSKCGQLEDFDGSLFEGPEPPPCIPCTTMDEVRTAVAGKRSHGIGRLRPRIVLYNEYNPDEEAIGNVSKADLRRGADAVIVVGTSLKIPGVRRLVKELCHTTRSRRDGFTAWINLDAEPQGAEFKDCWDLVVRGGSDDVAKLAGLPHWDEPDVGSLRSGSVTDDEDLLEKLEVILHGSVSSTKTKSSESGDTKALKETKVAAGEKTLPATAKVKSAAKPKASPAASIPTPSTSPKPQRKRLPDTRQSKLQFQQVKEASTKVSAGSKTGKKSSAAIVAAKEESKSRVQPAAKSTATIRVKTESVPLKLGETAKKARGSLSVAKVKKAVPSKEAKDKKTNNLSLAFRATKNVAASAPNGKTRKPLPTSRTPGHVMDSSKGKKRTAHTMEVGGDTSDNVERRMSSPEMDYGKLPTLRDSADNCEAHEPAEPHTPGTHSRRASEAETITPVSVPRGMDILIN